MRPCVFFTQARFSCAVCPASRNITYKFAALTNLPKMELGPATTKATLTQDESHASPSLSEFSCARCGGDTEACPLRCLSSQCMSIVCTECALTASSVYARCPVCGKRTNGVGKRQLARDAKLGRALRGAFPEEYSDRLAVGEREAASRRLDAALCAVARTEADPSVTRLVGNRNYGENARLMLLATLQNAEEEERQRSSDLATTNPREVDERVGRARYAALCKLLAAHVCDCPVPHVCVPKRSRKGFDYLSCPAFDLDAKGLTGASPTGCRFWRKVDL